jgi:hypothetical protein
MKMNRIIVTFRKKIIPWFGKQEVHLVRYSFMFGSIWKLGLYPRQLPRMRG